LNLGHFTSRSAERDAKLPVMRQAESEVARLVEHSEKTGVPVKDLFEEPHG
jgi:hypothetical protein